MSASVVAFAENKDRNSKLDDIVKHGCSSTNKNKKKPVASFTNVVDGMKFVGKIKLITPQQQQQDNDDEVSSIKHR